MNEFKNQDLTPDKSGFSANEKLGPKKFTLKFIDKNFDSLNSVQQDLATEFRRTARTNKVEGFVLRSQNLNTPKDAFTTVHVFTEGGSGKEIIGKPKK